MIKFLSINQEDEPICLMEDIKFNYFKIVVDEFTMELLAS